MITSNIASDLYDWNYHIQQGKRMRDAIVKEFMYDEGITAKGIIETLSTKEYQTGKWNWLSGIGQILHILSDEDFVFQDSSYHNKYDGAYGLLCKYGDKEFDFRASIYDCQSFVPLIEWILKCLREDE